MKKLVCMIALAAISFGSVFANDIAPVKATTQDTVMKKKIKTKKKVKKDSTMKKDTIKHL